MTEISMGGAATAVINYRALRNNLNSIRKIAPNSRVMAIIKANSYGHGLSQIANALDDIDAFGVARFNEALFLRRKGITKPILLLEGFFHADELTVIAEQNLATVVHNVEQLEALETTQLSAPIPVWLKVDTGMHRLGVRLEQADSFYQRLSKCKNVIQPVNIMSHFSSADEPEKKSTVQQIERFNQFIKDKPGNKSLAASAGILTHPESHYDWIRPGLILYGVSPMPETTGESIGLQPVMTLKSYLLAVREHQAEEPVGYNEIWVSDKDTRLGVVAVGYGDGYPRSAPSGTPVLLNGRIVPIVGRISMDMITIDLGGNATDKVGDEVILWGDSLPVEVIAEKTGISSYELLTKLTRRVIFEYKE